MKTERNRIEKESFVLDNSNYSLLNHDEALFEISLKNDFAATVKFVFYKGEKLGEDTLKRIAPILVNYIKEDEKARKDFVLNYLNDWLLKYNIDFLEISLKNNFNTTMKYIFDYNFKQKFGDENFKKIIEPIVVRHIKKDESARSEFVFDNLYLSLSYDEELFEISLKNNFSETMNTARKLDKKNLDKLCLLAIKCVREDEILRRNFVLSEPTYRLLKYDKSLLEISAKNNLMGTILVTESRKDDLGKEKFDELCLRAIKNIQKDKNIFETYLGDTSFYYVINFISKHREELGEETLRKIAPTITKYMKENKKSSLSYSDIYLLKYDEELAKLFLDSDFDKAIVFCSNFLENNPDDREWLSEIIVDYVKNNFEKVKDDLFKISKIVELNKMIDIFKGRKIFNLSDKILVEEGCLRANIPNISPEQISVIQHIVTNNEYSESLEREFLSLVGNVSNVEDYIKKFAFSGLTVKDMSLLQRVGLKLYCQKQLSKEGIEGVSVIFSTKDVMKYEGKYFHSDKRIEIYLSTLQNHPIKNMLLAIAHEKNHAVQHFNIDHCNIDKDLDVFVYSKDAILRSIDENYYERNYRHISIEFDAQFKAEMEVKKLLGIDTDYIYEIARGEIESAAQQNRESFLSTQDAPYRYEMIRIDENNNSSGQETLFRKKLMRKLSERRSFSFRKMIEENYPFIALGYDLDNLGRARTLEEMLDIIDCSDDEKVKKMCWFIIKERFDPARFSKEERNLMYDDYEMIRRYNFKDDRMKAFAQKFAESVERKLEHNSTKKFAIKI